MARTLRGAPSRSRANCSLTRSRAVEQLRVDPQEIGTVISASLYSLGCPTLAHRLVDHYEMDPTTDKYHITGVGCASARAADAPGAQTLREHPHKQALVVAAESMSGLLSPAAPGDPKAKVVASALFGDGCGAALLSADARAHGPGDSRLAGPPDRRVAGRREPAVRPDRRLPAPRARAARPRRRGTARRGRRLPAPQPPARRGDRPLDRAPRRPAHHRERAGVAGALRRGRGDELAMRWPSTATSARRRSSTCLRTCSSTTSPQPGERGLMVTIGPGVTVGLMLLGW